MCGVNTRNGLSGNIYNYLFSNVNLCLWKNMADKTNIWFFSSLIILETKNNLFILFTTHLQRDTMYSLQLPTYYPNVIEDQFWEQIIFHWNVYPLFKELLKLKCALRVLWGSYRHFLLYLVFLWRRKTDWSLQLMTHKLNKICMMWACFFYPKYCYNI